MHLQLRSIALEVMGQIMGHSLLKGRRGIMQLLDIDDHWWQQEMSASVMVTPAVSKPAFHGEALPLLTLSLYIRREHSAPSGLASRRAPCMVFSPRSVLAALEFRDSC
jgi:hypothetical protein